jgi:hypothetical protein
MTEIQQNDTKEEYIKYFRQSMQNKMRTNLLTAAIWELLIAIIIIALPYVLLLVQIDLIHPVSIRNIPLLWFIGYSALILVIIQCLYAAFINKLEGTKVGKILGWILGISMLIFLPYGTFFGILFLQDLKYPDPQPILESHRDWNEKTSRQIFLENASQLIMISGLIALFTAASILWLHKLILTQQVDISYPIITTAKIITIEYFGRIFFILFCVQIVIGFLYSNYAAKRWMKISVLIFAILQIFAIAIILEWFLIITAEFLFDDISLRSLIIGLGWIPGIIMRPLGLYFGIQMLRILFNEKNT